MGPAEILKLEIEREERGWIMMEFQKMIESSGEIPTCVCLLDKLRPSLEIIGSFLLGLFLGSLSLYFLYTVIRLMH
jgi:hypothetical protein